MLYIWLLPVLLLFAVFVWIVYGFVRADKKG
jgi:hypothetical protein